MCLVRVRINDGEAPLGQEALSLRHAYFPGCVPERSTTMVLRIWKKLFFRYIPEFVFTVNLGNTVSLEGIDCLV